MKRPASRTLLALLFLGVAAVLTVQALDLRQRLEREHIASAQDALDSIAASLTRACELGIPLDRISGIDEFVQSQLDPATGLTSLRLSDTANHLVWPRKLSGDSGRVLESPVGFAGRLRANFHSPSDAIAIARMAWALIAVALAISIPLLELARWGDVTRRGLVARHLREQEDAIQRGDFRIVRRVPSEARQGRQLRMLREGVIALGERFQRVTRLVESLRRTEPDDGRRARMGQIMSEAIGEQRFAGAVLERRIWPAAATARCFAVFIVLLTNLSLGDVAVAVESELIAGHPSRIDELALWSFGLLAGAWLFKGRWQARLTIGAIAAIATNLLFAPGNQWLGIMGCVTAGLATALAFGAALEASRARALKTSLLLLVSSLIAAPVIGSASLSALNALAEPRWLYIAAASIAVLALAGLIVQLADQPASAASRSWRVRPAFLPFLVGAAYSSALAAFIYSGAASQQRTTWLLLAQLPAWLWFARSKSKIRIAPSRIVAGFALGSLVSLSVLAATDALWTNLTRQAGVALILACIVSHWVHRRAGRQEAS